MPKPVKLLVNDETHNHEAELGKLLPGSKRMECMVAFAKFSGFKILQKNLEKALAAGLEARFAVGLSLFLTEPNLLRDLLKLESKNKFSVYISDTSETFHPKIYALSNGNKHCTVLIGSANLTGGGLMGNYEASALIDDPEGKLMKSVSNHIDELIADEALVRATSEEIDKYERAYIIHRECQRIAKHRAERAVKQVGVYIETLQEKLREMKRDSTEDGFDYHQTARRRHRKEAAKKIRELAAARKLNERTFLAHYEQLIGTFHSGGLHRGKNIVSRYYREFQNALADLLRAGRLSPGEAYQLLLNHFQHISRVGVNVITEILHAIDCKRFAVMNQNAVSGLGLANIHEFPSKPNKGNVNAERYAHFCQLAEIVRKELGLADFSELDALFNYAYWDRAEVGDDDE